MFIKYKINTIILCFTYAALTYLLSFIAYPLKYEAYDALQQGTSLKPILLSLFTPSNIIIITLTGASFLYSLYKRSFLHCAPMLLVILNAALFSHAYLEAGWLVTGDSNAHIARILHLMKTSEEGIFSGWSNFFYGGTPVLEFYSPLFFDLSSMIGSWLSSVYWGTKITLFFSNILSAVGLYYLLRMLKLEIYVAMVASIIYAGAFAHIHLVLLRGMFPQALIFMVMPWFFYSATKAALCFANKKYIPLLLSIMVLTALMLTHIISAFYIYILVLIFLFCYLPKHHYKSILITMLITGCVATAITSHTILPIFLEKTGLMMEHIPFEIELALPSLHDLSFLVRFRQGQVNPDDLTFIGYIPLLLVMVAGIFAKRHREIYIFLALLALCFIFKINYVRQGVLILFFLTLLSAYGLKIIYAKASPKLYFILSFLIALEMLIGSIYPLARTDKLFFDDIAQTLQQDFPQQRIIPVDDNETSYKISIGPSGGLLAMYDIQKLEGPHNRTVPKTHNYQAVILKQLQHDLNETGHFSDQTKRFLCLYNVGAIALINHKKQSYKIIPTKCAAPVRFAPYIEKGHKNYITAESDIMWQETTLDEDISLSALEVISKIETSDNHFYLRDDIPDHPVGITQKENIFTIDDYSVTRTKIHLTVTSQQAGYMRLAHPVYHGLHIMQNGVSVTPLQDISAAMVLPISAGQTDIIIEAKETDLRKFLSLFSNLVFLSVVSLLVFYGTKEGKRYP